MDKMVIWGNGIRGKQLIKALDTLGVKVDAVLDNDPNKWGGLVCGFDEYRQNNNVDETTFIIALVYTKAAREVIQQIRSVSKKCKIISSYEAHKLYERKYLQGIYKDNYSVDFKKQFVKWHNNIDSEIKFWRDCVVAEGSKYRDAYEKRRKNNIFRFSFESNRFIKLKGGEVVLDVGSGIVSQYGNETLDGKVIDLVAVDPLAKYYNNLTKKDGVDEKNKINKTVRFGFFEFLSYSIGEDVADIIIIENALDHCIDPVAAICEALKVLKIGGQIELFHCINEGYYCNYNGLHNWNIDCDESGEMIIWNSENYININKLLGEYTDIDIIEISDKERNGAETSGCIGTIITKRKEIPEEFNKSKQHIGIALEELI